ncbi:TPA: restriction endonuclease subunit S [Elizabethkingia anophelis]|uniref:restriction endonuclease subunit S n=1 Tax=Elizabethkingia anophelis TaxID=1117645 RepID=UPI001A2C7E99|nr:restriction endonuclease subunit S [Elizabethkingia anophelis]HAT3998700.1 restriction endonuclease subunit S [Elizabethkingia anophelis]HAT4009704.1 restriction endonuclease subunit S [Elizabethkingia anophelis]HAY3501812.1 restriction endonuclease subunit S [Elizabethkingia anophelis]HAY3510152.1 restriction endonuclease subunit S [Elizabethkingia anophelis]
MKPYDTYKDSGIEWIGEIPSHWEVKKIKHRCYVKARVGWKGLKSDEFLQEGYAYLVTGSDFKNDKVNWKECYHIDKERYEEDPYIQLQDEDLLITKDGTIGKLAIVNNLDKPACLNSGIFVVRSTKDDFSTEFLFWILKSKMFTQFNEYTSYGSTIQHLYQNVFVEFGYTFPSKEEQTAIASYLDRKTAEIDALIADKKRLLELYEEEKTAIINQAVTKGIDPKVKMKDSGIEWLGEIPEHWKFSPLKYLGRFINGYSFKSTDFSSSGVRVLKISNIQHMRIDWSDESFIDSSFYESNKNFRVLKNDLVFALTRPIISSGIKVALVDSIEKILLNQRNSIYRPTDINVKWIYYILLSPSFIEEFDSRIDKTGQQPNISSNDIGEIVIPIPEESEQNAIIKFIDKQYSIIENKVAETQKLIELLTEYRTALINEVVTGKIKVIH